MTLTFDLESGVRVMCDEGYCVPILVFLGLSVLELFPMYATDRRQTDRQTDRHQTKASLNASALTGRGIMTMYHCRFLNIEAGILFSRSSERDLKDFADGFFFLPLEARQHQHYSKMRLRFRISFTSPRKSRDICLSRESQDTFSTPRDSRAIRRVPAISIPMQLFYH